MTTPTPPENDSIPATKLEPATIPASVLTHAQLLELSVRAISHEFTIAPNKRKITFALESDGEVTEALEVIRRAVKPE